MNDTLCASELDILLDYQALRDFESWPDLFGNDHPIKVDIGCGKDPFLIQCALQEPRVNFVGIESDIGMAYRLEKKVRQSGVGNVRIVSFNALFALRRLFSSESVQSFFLQFPDPWPKRRHAKRRILSLEFLRELRERLASGGDFFVATDVPDMAQLALALIERLGGFFRCDGQKSYPILTLYEQRFLTQGRPIYYLRFVKRQRTEDRRQKSEEN